MSTVMLLHESVNGSWVEARRPRLRDRLAVRLHSADLDRLLADGASPDQSLALALRAGDLCRASARDALARRLWEVIEQTQRPPATVSSAVPICRAKVRSAREELMTLARRLVVPGPVAVRGVALARLLLTDGASALYARPGADDLAVAAEQARVALEPWSPLAEELTAEMWTIPTAEMGPVGEPGDGLWALPASEADDDFRPPYREED